MTGKFFEIEFCSKVSFSPDGTVDGWSMTRDPKKVLMTK
jgi:hypothetical protein